MLAEDTRKDAMRGRGLVARRQKLTAGENDWKGERRAERVSDCEDTSY